MNCHDRQKNGFTLVELVIALTISILIFLIVIASYDFNQKLYSDIDTRSEIIQNGRVIIDRLVREVRQAQKMVTNLPPDTSDPDNLPDEIIFQDGHDNSVIKYIRYYLTGSDLKRQVIAYYFADDPDNYVYWDATDNADPHGPPTMIVLEDRVIGEYVDDVEFWGNKLININIYLYKNNHSEIINTAVYGRNL
ncbi:MAG: prepilin-type N-terminal cleavage/methylation domain-containing protein [Patescibacteria group bacterium]